MDQQFLEKIFNNYDHLRGRYLGCFCKDKMDKLQRTIIQTVLMYERLFALLNTGSKHSNGEHWMGLVINMRTRHTGYFDTFGCRFKWLCDAMEQLFPNKFHRTLYKVQSESSATCGLHTVYFIIRMIDPKNKLKYTETIDVGQYTRSNYDVKEASTKLKDQDIVNHLSRKFKTNFNMLLSKK